MENQSKRERFERVASKRVQTVISTLGLLQNCANKHNYDYTQDDVDRMFAEITKALKEAKQAYTPKTKPTFNFEGKK